MTRSRLIAVLACGLLASTTIAVEPLSFPADARVVDIVEKYGATPNDDLDDTAAIATAFEKDRGSGTVLYLRPGRYVLSKTIDWGGARTNTILQGAGAAETIIQLADEAQGFTDPSKPRPMFFTGGPPAQRFRNSVRDLTIDTGKGNPGAIGLNFCANNQGMVHNVVIRSGEDGSEAGAIGLGLIEGEVGPLLVENLTVIGFDVGIQVRHNVNSVTLENITLRNQRRVGLANDQNMVYARRLTSENVQGPAVVNEGANAVVALIDSTLRGGNAAATAAIENRHPSAMVFLRDVTTSGYGASLRDLPTARTVPAGAVSEWVSMAPLSLWPGEMTTLRLPIEDIPVVPFEPADKWVNIETFGGSPDDAKDDSAALQAAIDSGATTIYLPRGRELPPSRRANNPGWERVYVFSDTISIRNNVRRIIGLEAGFKRVGKLTGENAKPLFVFENGSAPVVILERMLESLDTINQLSGPFLEHRADRDLVISAMSAGHRLRHVGKGKLFLNDMVANLLYVGPGSRLWARQLNLEGDGWKLTNDGGQVWILGLKTEARGPVIRTLNGGKTEVIGGHLYKCVEPGVDADNFIVDNAHLSLAAVTEYAWTRSWGSKRLVTETRGDETREIGIDMLAPRNGGSTMPLVAAFPSEVKGSSPSAPKISVADASSSGFSLAFSATDPEGDIAGFKVERDGKPRPTVAASLMERGLTPDSAYTYRVRAYDRYGNESDAVEQIVRTLPDTGAPSVPGSLTSDRITDQFIAIQWKASKDDIGVSAYEVSRNEVGQAPQIVGEIQGLEFEDSKVKLGTQYVYTVRAIDTAGNKSDPATIEVKTLAHPPNFVDVTALRWTAKAGDVNDQGGYAGNIHGGVWMHYAGVELGRESPFDQVTLRYAIPNDRAGAEVEIWVGASLERDGRDRKPVGGEKVVTFTIEGTGGWGWKEMKEFTQPIRLKQGGRQSVTLVVNRAGAKVGNALVNIHRIRFSDSKAK